MLSIKNIKLELYEDEKLLKSKILKKLKIDEYDLIEYHIVKKSIDSRNKNNVHHIYNVNVNTTWNNKLLKIKGVEEAKEYEYKVEKVNYQKRPIIIGTGPAGLLAGIILAEAGLNPILIEQGKEVDQRKKDIDEFWKTGKLNTSSNVQFGAGGAGTFSDGKLTTGISNPKKHKLVQELILAGAPEEIRYLGKPHIGTDILIEVVRNLCTKITSLGGEILYETTFLSFEQKDNQITKIEIEKKNKVVDKIETDYLILAIGHSARETFYELQNKNIAMKPKPFSVGVRIEHLQSEVNKGQYGEAACKLDAASYKVNTHLKERSVYTFCMCPGGVVVGAASEEGRLTTNGMSYFSRNEKNSNAALLVNVLPSDFNGEENPLNGIKFQRELEELSFIAGGKNYYAPAQKVGDFLNDKVTTKFGKVEPSYLPGVTKANLNDIFPKFITESLKEGIKQLENKMAIYKDEEAVLTGIESRSSSPVTILRDENFMSNIYGIIPCGEGAGYAGGIVSAAIDGIRCAEKVIEQIKIKN